MRSLIRLETLRPFFLATAAVLLLALAACGGGSDSAGSAPVAEQPMLEPVITVNSGPGSLVRAERLGTVSAAAVTQTLNASRLALAGARPRYDVQTWRLRYRTRDDRGAEVEASGLLAVPVKTAGQPSPVLSYQHGTIFKDSEAPSNVASAEEPTVALASLGFLTVAPDYLGYGASKGLPHPYLRAAPSAAVVVDMLTAARLWRQQAGVRGNGQLFLLGYSEGGYATMAAHRTIQATNSHHREQLVAAFPGAGPYHVTVTMNGLLDAVKDRNRLIGTLLQPGLLRYLGSSVREEVREELVKALIPKDADVVFDTTFIDQFLADDEPALERDSNVHDWVPTVPVMLFHGRADRTVPYASAAVTVQTQQARSGNLVSLTECTAETPDHLPCVAHWFSFVLARLGERARNL